MLELKSRPTFRTSEDRVALESQQPRRLLLALILLLVALGGVLVRDRDFWFSSVQPTVVLDGVRPAVAHRSIAKPVPNAAPPAPAHTVKKQTPAASHALEPKPVDRPVVETRRTVLPPLDVEVVAGDNHRTIRPGVNAAKVELRNSGAASAARSTDTFSTPTNAAERERVASDVAQPSYPLLAQHMNVQGSVVLQAVIGADGIIQNLRILSGPAILASAAQQAVREWRFKPVLQNGQAVETKAKITVNFTIKVADNSANATLAESRNDRIQVLTR